MNVHQATAKGGTTSRGGTHRRSPVVMVLQNERFYADFIEEMLATAGFSVGGTFWRCSDTAEWLKSESPDVAVIDAEVQDGRCHDVAAVLHARGVPFVVYSTMSIVEPVSVCVLAHGIFLRKPSSREKMLSAVRAVLARR